MRNICKFAASDSRDQRLLEQESYLRKRYYANLTQSESSNDNFGWGCNWVFNSKWILYFAYLPLQCIYIPPRSCFQNSLLLLRNCRNKGFVVPVISCCRDSVVKPKRSRFACFSCFPLAIMIHTSFLLQNQLSRNNLVFLGSRRLQFEADAESQLFTTMLRKID